MTEHGRPGGRRPKGRAASAPENPAGPVSGSQPERAGLVALASRPRLVTRIRSKLDTPPARPPVFRGDGSARLERSTDLLTLASESTGSHAPVVGGSGQG